MTAWGDYAITAVRYNLDETRIKQVKRQEVDLENSQLSRAETIPRQNVVTEIERDVEYTTAIESADGDWSLGDEIHVLDIGGTKFIRTDQNGTKEDNLEGLPTF